MRTDHDAGCCYGYFHGRSFSIAAYDLINPGNLDLTGVVFGPTSQSLVLRPGTVFTSHRGFRAELRQHPPAVQEEWSVVVDVTQDRRTSGYIFAKTSRSGAVRYYALCVLRANPTGWAPGPCRIGLLVNCTRRRESAA